MWPILNLKTIKSAQKTQPITERNENIRKFIQIVNLASFSRKSIISFPENVEHDHLQSLWKDITIDPKRVSRWIDSLVLDSVPLNRSKGVKMLQRSSVKASRSATGQITRHRSPQGLSISMRATGKLLMGESHLPHRLHSSISQPLRGTATVEALAAGVRAAVSLRGVQMKGSNMKANSTRSSRLGVCWGFTRSLNGLTDVDTLARGKSSSRYCYCVQLNSDSFHQGPPIRLARAWKSTSAPAVAEHGVSASGEGKGELRRFCLTDIGEGIMEVEMLKWHVQPGDRVKQFDKLCEVQSDKANVEITSRFDGVVRKIHWSVGDMIETGSVLVDIEEDGVVSAAAPRDASSPERFELSSAEAVRERDDRVGDRGGREKQVLTTPAVRMLCRELSIDLARANIVGTGPEGRVLKHDVLAYTKAADGAVGEREEVPRFPEALFSGAAADVVEGGKRQRRDPVVVPIKAGVPKAMMEAMQRSLQIPHMTFCDEVNADGMSVLKKDLQEAAEQKGVKLSYLPLIIKATSMALTSHPTLNASVSEDKCSLLQYPDHNIGVAMDTEKGLLVPCISGVQELSLLEIAQELNTLQRLGAAGKLGEAELEGTTFTLSNIGSIGGTYVSPVILHPQVCIGALGRMQRVPRFDLDDPDKVIAAKIFPISWSADHRVVDGATLAQFSNTWKAYLENPARMLADTR